MHALKQVENSITLILTIIMSLLWRDVTHQAQAIIMIIIMEDITEDIMVGITEPKLLAFILLELSFDCLFA